MKAKIIEMSTLLRTGFEKTEISRQLNVSRKTVQRVNDLLVIIRGEPGSIFYFFTDVDASMKSLLL